MEKQTMRMIAMVLAALLLCSCTVREEYPEQPSLEPGLPPELQPGQPEERFQAKLYFLSEAQTLVVEERTVERYPDQSRAEAVLEVMLEGPESGFLRGSLPEGLSLERVELCGTVANVVFSGMMPYGNEWLVARAAVAAAVCASEENIGAVNVYLEDQEPGYRGKPLGTLAPITGSLDLYLEGLYTEFGALSGAKDQNSDGFETREATLYYLDASGQWLLGRTRELQYAKTATTETLVWMLMDELTKDAPGEEALLTALPQGLALAIEPELEEVPEQDEDSILREDGSSGECIVHLTFYRPEAPVDEVLLRAALALTITGFIPEVRGVSVTFVEPGSQPEEGLYDTPMRRKDCVKYLGHTVDLLYPEAEGSVLVREAYTMPQTAVYNAELRLKALLEHTSAFGSAYPLFTGEDVLSVETAEGMAVVNWSKGFAANLAELIHSHWSGMASDRRERMFVFGVVNSIAQIPGINRVWMLEDGAPLNTVDRIHLGKALLKNPGLVVD